MTSTGFTMNSLIKISVYNLKFKDLIFNSVSKIYIDNVCHIIIGDGKKKWGQNKLNTHM